MNNNWEEEFRYIIMKTNEKIIVNCKTQVEYDKLMKYLESIGGKWCSNQLPTKGNNVWPQDEDKTCINVSNIKELYYSGLDYYQRSHTILTFQEYLQLQKSSIFIGQESINQTNPIKKLMTNFKQIIKDIKRTEPNKTYIKAGFIDSNENLTAEGIEALQYVLWENNQEELTTLANKIIAAGWKKLED